MRMRVKAIVWDRKGYSFAVDNRIELKSRWSFQSVFHLFGFGVIVVIIIVVVAGNVGLQTNKLWVGREVLGLARVAANKILIYVIAVAWWSRCTAHLCDADGPDIWAEMSSIPNHLMHLIDIDVIQWAATSLSHRTHSLN